MADKFKVTFVAEVEVYLDEKGQFYPELKVQVFNAVEAEMRKLGFRRWIEQNCTNLDMGE